MNKITFKSTLIINNLQGHHYKRQN